MRETVGGSGLCYCVHWMSFKHYITAFGSSGDSIHTLMISKLQLLKLQQEELGGGGSAKAFPQKQTYC